MSKTSRLQRRDLQTNDGLKISETKASFHIGPLPSPEMLEAYEKAYPGIAERILKMAEKEQEKRHQDQTELIEMERKNLRSLNWNIIRGQIFALLAIVIVCLLCAYFAYLGDIPSASGTAKVIIIGVASVFLGVRILSRTKKEE